MVAVGLVIASEVTGFISFAITILTLLETKPLTWQPSPGEHAGVYRDLLSTLRHAPTQIPIMLGNLRQEIITEKAFLQYRIKQGDRFNVFPRSLRSIGARSGTMAKRENVRHHFSRLMEATVRDLWIEFRNLERPFLISDPMRAEAVERGDYWGDEDVKLKPRPARRERRSGRRVGGGGDEEKGISGGGGGSGGYIPGQQNEELAGVEPMRMTEQGIRDVGARYYRTDLTHRFIWWQSKDDVLRLMDQVQRIQIRRLERDVFECDELVKRICKGGGLAGGGNVGSGGSNGSPSGSDGGGGGDRRGSGSRRSIVRSRAGSARSVRMPSRAGSRAGTGVREVDEVERVRRRAAPSPPREREVVRQSEGEASNTGRRRDRRSGPRVEYEVVRPGPDGVYVVDGAYGRPSGRGYAYEEDSRGVERRRSYSRER